MRGRGSDPYDPSGADLSEPTRFVVLSWSAVALFSLMMALVAWHYGTPDYNGAQTAALGADQLANRNFDAAGASDLVSGMQPIDGNPPNDIVAIRVENSALRQGLDSLRNQVGMLSDRITQLDNKFSELTGSVDARPAMPASQPAASIPELPGDAAIDEADGSLALPRTQFGIEIGTYSDLSALKEGWARFQEDDPYLFGDLEALATVRDRDGRTELLLVAGPFPNAEAASKRCTVVEKSGVSCLPAFYLGQDIATR